VDVLPALRRCGEFATALLWELERGRPAIVLGKEPSPKLAQDLAPACTLPGVDVVTLPASASDGVEIGFAVALPAVGHSIVLLSDRILPESAQGLIANMLGDLATVVAAAT
jgi:hypothetical protein